MAFERKLFLDIFGRDRGASKMMDDVADSSDKVDDRIVELTEDSDKLGRQLDTTKGKLRDLLTEFRRTGNEDLFKQINPLKRQKSRLESTQKLLTQLEKEAADAADEAGDGIGDAIMAGIKASLSSASMGPLIAVLAGVGVAAAPFIGGVVSGAVLGGVGAGGLVGGVALAASDPRIKDAASSMGGVVSAAFKTSAIDFVAPVDEAIDHIEEGLVDVASELRPTFRSLAQIVVPISDGFVGLIKEGLPGFKKGLEESKPVLRFLGQALPRIGRELGNFIAVISEDTDGAILALDATVRITTALIRNLGTTFNSLSRIYEFSVRTGAAVSGSLEDVFGWMPGVGMLLSPLMAKSNDSLEGMITNLDKAKDGSHDFSGSLDDVADSATAATEKIATLSSAFDNLFGITMQLDTAQINFAESLRGLSDELGDGARSLSLNTEAGLENQRTVLSHIRAIDDLRQANVANGMAVDDANKIYGDQLRQLEAVLVKLGFNKREIRALVDAYKSIPETVTSRLRIEGLEGQVARVKELARLLGSLAAGAAAAAGGSYISGRAGGGPVKGGTTYIVGEEGPELVRFDRDGYVINAKDTAAMVGQPVPYGAMGGGWAGMAGGPPQVTINFSMSGNPFADAVMSAFREYVRAESGGRPDDFFGSTQ